MLAAAPLAARAADPPLAEYFRAETARIAARPLAGIDSAEAWKAARPRLQAQLREMLGLDPMPDRGDLHARITGKVERPDFVVEKLLYQSSPGLYVTANLYRPKKIEGRLPAILYVCGHSKVEKDGLILGCKAHYQHHANWFAANGYVCLVLDTLQLGELPGLHHGTAREGMWWWQSRGYTPAGVEAWNAVRGIDYLVSRADVDPTRIGVTGRSGGGATSWWVGAIDDRVAAVAPVAGITDLEDHVVDGVVEGHCDCMYFVNTDRWDYPTVAALVAPKPLFVVNTDKDPIFPEDGVRRVYAQAEKVYGWYDARPRLGLLIGKGGHADTTEIRHPTYAFFEKYLKGKDVDPSKIDEPDRKVPIEELKVLRPGEVPPYVRNGVIHESFAEASPTPPVPHSAEAWEGMRSRWLAEARSKVLGGWPGPGEVVPPNVEAVISLPFQGGGLFVHEFTSQTGVRLRLWSMVGESDRRRGRPVTLFVVDQAAWDAGAGEFLGWFDRIGDLARAGDKGIAKDLPDPTARLKGTWMSAFNEAPGPVAFLAPRGVGPTAWPASKDVQVRRRFALLGQSLDGMRAWDVARAAALLPDLPDLRGLPVRIAAQGQGAPLALWAAAFEPKIKEVTLFDPPATWRDGPAFQGVDRVLAMPQAPGLLYPRPLTLIGTPREPWTWASDLARQLGAGRDWPTFRDRFAP
jgi:cephalosporin-C deacetylase-like acetyl esterase